MTVTTAEKERLNLLSGRVIGAAMEVHKILDPGLLESAYEGCLCRELVLGGISLERQVLLPVEYKGLKLDCGYRMDLLVEKSVIVEIKSIESLEPIHEAQLLTYLRLTKLWLGLLVNFNVPVLKDGIKRLVNGQDETTEAQRREDRMTHRNGELPKKR